MTTKENSLVHTIQKNNFIVRVNPINLYQHYMVYRMV